MFWAFSFTGGFHSRPVVSLSFMGAYDAFHQIHRGFRQTHEINFLHAPEPRHALMNASMSCKALAGTATHNPYLATAVLRTFSFGKVESPLRMSLCGLARKLRVKLWGCNASTARCPLILGSWWRGITLHLRASQSFASDSFRLFETLCTRDFSSCAGPGH